MKFIIAQSTVLIDSCPACVLLNSLQGVDSPIKPHARAFWKSNPQRKEKVSHRAKKVNRNYPEYLSGSKMSDNFKG